ncbi:MAG: DUF4386 domain-containing protein [Actinomycetota bacterium]|nr:DUF4386 domain-containing protein [Actinomycetota bacterium]
MHTLTPTEHATNGTAPGADTSTRTAARVAGLGYAALFFLAMFANFVVRLGLVDDDDPAATVDNIVADELMFRGGLAAFVAVFVIDVAVAWGLYVLLRPGGQARSLLAAWFRMAYTVMLGVAATFMFLALQLSTDGALASGLDAAERASWTSLAVQAFDYTWLVGLVAFGIHLVLVGRLMASAMGARVLGLLLAVVGVAYVFDTAAHTLYSNYADHADLFLAIVATPSIIAELWFTFWLLRRGWGREDDTTELAAAGTATTERLTVGTAN